MSSRTDKDRLIRRILRVDHAGEHGAVSIYTTQIKYLRRPDPATCAWLSETLAHEISHRQKFKDAMPSRRAKPCRALGVWSVGGKVLGATTALLGQSAVMACTAAVERTVHGHLLDQIGFLKRYDAELAHTVEAILDEELGHLAYAEAAVSKSNLLNLLIEPVIVVATELMIAISTRGDSLRLKHDLAQLAAHE